MLSLSRSAVAKGGVHGLTPASEGALISATRGRVTLAGGGRAGFCAGGRPPCSSGPAKAHSPPAQVSGDVLAG